MVLAIGGWSHRWVAEDAFINFRVVDVTLHGQPFAFNVGERVEAGTSPLWVAVLVALRTTLGWVVDLAWLSLLVGLALTLIGLAAAIAGSARLAAAGSAGRDPAASGSPRILVPAGALVLAALPPMWDFATSGLETGLTFAWIGGCFWLLAGRANGRDRPPATSPPSARARRWIPVIIGLGPLVRPDLALFSAAFLVALVVATRCRGRELAHTVARAAALPGAFQLFRMAYFGTLVPNTALAKEAGVANWPEGLAYLDNLGTPYRLWIPLVAIAAWGAVWILTLWRDGRRAAVVVTAAPIAAALIHGAYVTRVGGDFMHGRLLLPATFGVFAPLAALPIVPVTRRAVPNLAAAGLATWAVVCATSFRLPAEHPEAWRDIVDERQFWDRASQQDNSVTLEDHREISETAPGRRARQLAAAGADVLVLTSGAEVPLAPGSGVMLEAHIIGLASMSAGPDVRVVDLLGLADAFGGRIVADPHGRVGHQKHITDTYKLARLPLAPGGPLPGDAEADEVEAARRSLACAGVRAVGEATTEALTPRRALRNVLDAPALTKVRFTLEPRRASACDVP